MNYTWLLFDADGTIFDYDAAEGKALSGAFAQYGLPFEARTLDIYRDINARLWRELEAGTTTPARLQVQRFAQLFEALAGDEVPTEQRTALAALEPATFSADYLTHLGQAIDLIPGAITVLDALKSQVNLALITNGLTKVQRSRLAISGLDSYFEVVVISEEIGAAKPDPEIFNVAFERMGQPPKSSVLMIGDSLTSDMRGAVRYGLDACWFNPLGRPREPDLAVTYEIRDLRELLLIVRDGPKPQG